MEIKILIIDDDPHICELVILYGEKQGYTMYAEHSGIKGLDRYYELLPDLVILDIMLPELDGWEICQEIRKDYKTPIIMLTGKGESYDKIRGFELGTDDYLVKPFDPKELTARIKAVLKRSNPHIMNEEIVVLPTFILSNRENKVLANGKEVIMAPKEMELLHFLASHSNQVFTRRQILDQIWGYDYLGDARTVDVHIKRIREKLGEDHEGWSLRTIRGIGYKFEVPK